MGLNMIKKPFIEQDLVSENYSVIMKNGSIKIISNVEKGDILMGQDGTSRIVKNAKICDGLAYIVKPIKGSPFVLGADNYLCLLKVGANGCFLDIHVCDFEKQSEHFKKNYKLYRTTGIDFKNRKNPVIDPYFLGLLLGDACLRKLPIKLTNPEQDIIDYVVEITKSMDLSTNVCKIVDANCFNTFIGSNRKRNNILREELKNLGLWGKLSHQKFIPNLYKLGAKAIRTQVLAGLIDTDGTLTNCNSVRYYTTSERLANDTGFVSRSLGLGCSIFNSVKRKDTWNPCYTLSIYGDFSNIPIRVKRKIPDPRKSIKNVLKTGFSIQKLEKPTIYYKLEFEGEDQHYLKSDFVVMKGGNDYVM